MKRIKEEFTYMNLINLIKTLIFLWALSIILVVVGFLLYLNHHNCIVEIELQDKYISTENNIET